MKQVFPLLAVALLALLPAETSSGAEQPDWSADVTPYLWVAGVSVDSSLPSFPAGSPGVERFETRISAGAMLATHFQYRSFGFLTDFAWLRLNTESVNPGPAYSAVNLKSDFFHVTTALTYELPLRDPWRVRLLGGARLWHTANEAGFEPGILPGFHTSADRTWVDPIVGADISYALTPKWSLNAKGTAGGFGVSADMAWEAFGGITYRFTDTVSATVGYRYLQERYSQNRYGLKLDAHGVLVGVGFHF